MTHVTQAAYQVDYLLSVSRVPRRFYALIMGLDGRDAIYKNPGVSLQSYVIARCVKNEITTLDPEMVECVRECESFGSSKEVLAKINEALISSATKLISFVSSLAPDKRSTFVQDVTQLHNLANIIKNTFDAFISTQDAISMHVDLASMSGITYKQAIFDMQDAVENLSFKLEHVTNPSPEVA